jgi:hypothetical protein
MRARTYALGLVGAAATLFLAVAGANLLIDPAGIFGTSPLPRHTANANERYLSFAAFKAGEARYDGLLFGSSRARAIPLEDLERVLGTTNVASFAVNGGVLADHVPVLDYVVRNPPAGRRVVRAVFVLLDADGIGDRPPTNFGPATYLPPELTGESRIRFWWKNLTGLTVMLWQSAVREAFGPAERPRRRESRLPWDTAKSALGAALSMAAQAQALGPAALPPRKTIGLERIAERRQYQDDVERWRRIVALCRSASIKLVAAFGPLRRENLERYEDVERVVADFSAIAPVWDFTRFDRLADDRTLWEDESHYDPRVSRLMLSRIAGEPLPPGWENLGRLRSRQEGE